MAFKDRIREARLSNDLTQEQLARKIGVAKSTLAGYEKGNREPNLETTIKIMSALKIDANYLWQDEINFPISVTYDEMNHIKKYRALDAHGKEMVDFTLEKEWERSEKSRESNKHILDMPEHLIAKAAHERTDINVTEEMRKHDDDIMDDDSEWE